MCSSFCVFHICVCLTIATASSAAAAAVGQSTAEAEQPLPPGYDCVFTSVHTNTVDVFMPAIRFFKLTYGAPPAA